MMSQLPTIDPHIIKEPWSYRSTMRNWTFELYKNAPGDENQIVLHFPFEDSIVTFLTDLKYVNWSQRDCRMIWQSEIFGIKGAVYVLGEDSRSKSCKLLSFSVEKIYVSNDNQHEAKIKLTK